jgi:hypothetical protein
VYSNYAQDALEKSERFAADLKELVERQRRYILNGQFPGGYERYQRECGILSGLEKALDLFDGSGETETLGEL